MNKKVLMAASLLGIYSSLQADKVVIFPTEFTQGDIAKGSYIKSAFIPAQNGYSIPMVTISPEIINQYRKLALTISLPHFAASNAILDFLKINKVTTSDRDELFGKISSAIEDVGFIDKSGYVFQGEKIYIYELSLSQIGITPKDFENTTEDWTDISPGELLSAAKGERTLDPDFTKKVSPELIKLAQEQTIQKILIALEPSPVRPPKPGAGKKMEIVIIPSYLDANDTIRIGAIASKEGYLPIVSALVDKSINSKEVANSLLLTAFKKSAHELLSGNAEPILITMKTDIVDPLKNNAKPYDQLIYNIEIKKDKTSFDQLSNLINTAEQYTFQPIATISSLQSPSFSKVLKIQEVQNYIQNLVALEREIKKEPTRPGEGGEGEPTIQKGELKNALVILRSQFDNLGGVLTRFAENK